MCGIAGTLHLDGSLAKPDPIEVMTDALSHRGPDGRGTWTEGPASIGHRRLSILDLTRAGAQPMLSPDQRYILSFNGEIYNFRELRDELRARGRRFRSRSDTEVLLAAFEAWGTDAIPRLNGMFAFAIWDRERSRLVLARDRYGIKPLYWSPAKGSRPLLFGSEIKALLAHPAFSAELDTSALIEYFTFQNLFRTNTLFRDVEMLPAGSWLEIPAHGGAPGTPQEYWDFSFHEDPHPGSEAEVAEELNRLFVQAVERQLVADVDVSTYLSGGVDSGAITAVAAQQRPHLRTFTCGFDLSSASGVELGFDERQKAERLSYLLGTEHYEVVLKSGDMERAMPRLARHIEEMRVGQSYPNLYVAGLASRFAPVVLSGTGGDELFAGYPWRYYRAVVNDDFSHYLDKYYGFWQRLVPDEAAADFFSPIAGAFAETRPREIFEGVFREHARHLTRPEDYVNHGLYFEAKTFLHGLLVVEDKLSMAHGLEARVPFLDNDLVDFAQRIPVRMKLGNLGEVVRLNENEPGDKTRRYFEKTRDGKLIMRRALARYVPDEVSQRVKQGFSAPDASWFSGDSIDYVRARLCRPDARIYDYLEQSTSRRLLDEHLSGQQNRRLLIWSLLSFESFLETFFPA